MFWWRSCSSMCCLPTIEYMVLRRKLEAIRCMRHSKRTNLMADDVNRALSLRNVEDFKFAFVYLLFLLLPIYGFESGDPLRFKKKTVGHKDLFYNEDKDIEFNDVIDAPLPKASLDTAVVGHWLAIEGSQAIHSRKCSYRRYLGEQKLPNKMKQLRDGTQSDDSASGEDEETVCSVDDRKGDVVSFDLVMQLVGRPTGACRMIYRIQDMGQYLCQLMVNKFWHSIAYMAAWYIYIMVGFTQQIDPKSGLRKNPCNQAGQLSNAI